MGRSVQETSSKKPGGLMSRIAVRRAERLWMIMEVEGPLSLSFTDQHLTKRRFL